MDWMKQAHKLLSEGIVGTYARTELVERVARLLQIESELQVASKRHIDDIAATPTPGFDAKIVSENTVEELVTKYRDICGALIVAAEEELQGRNEDGRTPSLITQGRVSVVINEWLTQAQQRQMLGMLPKDGLVH